ACLDVRRVARERALKSRLGLVGDDAVRGSEQRLGEIGLAVGVGAIETQRVAARLHGIVEAAEPQIDWRHHLPAAAILGIAREMRLDLRNEAFERAVLRRRIGAARKWLARKLWRAEREIGCGR